MGAFSNMDYELQNSEAAVSDAFIPSPSSMTMRETRFPLLTATAIPPAIPTMD